MLSRVLQALAVIVVAGGAGFLAYRLTASHTTALSAAPASPAAQPAAEPPPAQTATPVPEAVPELALADLAGVRHRLSEWRGRPTLFNFWATWCAPCRREIPLLQRLRHEHASDGLQVVGIAVDLRDSVLEYAHQMQIDYPLLIGEQDGFDAVSAFGMQTVFPFTVFTDSRARIVTLKIGELHEDEAAFILDRVRDLDAGRVALAAAREQIAARVRQLAAERARTTGPSP